MTSNRDKKAVVASLIIFSVTFMARYRFNFRGYMSAGDFGGALLLARNILNGLPPYTGFTDVPYPIVAGFWAIPFTLFNNRLAGTLFIALSYALLTFIVIHRTGQTWRLLMFLAKPFAHALEWAQWSPLIMATWYLPILTPVMVLIKPQIALPLAINRPNVRGIVIAGAILVLSLVLFPLWPQQWLSMTQGYQYIIPVLLPWGGLLMLSLLAWPREKAKLLTTMAFFPVRGAYDLTLLFIFPDSLIQMIILVTGSWLLPFHLLYVVLSLYCLCAIITPK